MHVAHRIQAVAHEGIKPVGIARNATHNGIDREWHGVVRVNHDDVFGRGTYGSPHPSFPGGFAL